MATIKDLLSTMIGKINEKKHWNDIEGKPFGETVTYGDTLTWDGNTEGLVPIDIGTGMPCYKVSDLTPSMDILVGSTIESVVNGEIQSRQLDSSSMILKNDAIAIMEGAAVVALVDGAFNGLFPTAGVYFGSMGESTYVSSLTIPNFGKFETTEIQTIDPKYLPSGGGAFVVKFETEDGVEFTADKTHMDIVQALQDGIPVTAILFNADMFQWTGYNLYFVEELSSHFLPADANYSSELVIYSDGTVSLNSGK